MEGTQKYLDLIRESQSESESAATQFQADTASLAAQADLLATKQSVANCENELALLKRAYPLECSKIIEKQIELESYKDGQKRLEALIAELF